MDIDKFIKDRTVQKTIEGWEYSCPCGKAIASGSYAQVIARSRVHLLNCGKAKE